MTREQAQQFLPLIEAYAAGEVIQYRYSPSHEWEDVTHADFSDPFDHYRIKPKPQTRIMTLADMPDGPIWVKYDHSGSPAQLVLEATSEYLMTASSKVYFKYADKWNWSTSHKGPWKPFTVEVEASA